MVIKIHIYLFLVLAYMYAIQNLESFIFTYMFIILHELAHVVIALILRVEICEIELLPIGINAKYRNEISSLKIFLISLAGPIASFLFYNFLKVAFLKNINLLIAITNLIPLKPYDGGKIIHSLLSLLIGDKKANKISITIQKISLNLLGVIAIISLVKLKNYYLVIACIYMICIVKEDLKNEKFNDLIKYLQIE